MTTVGASRYPQPAPSRQVLAELAAEYCVHDGVPGRCPMCRAAETVPDPPSDPPAPTTPRPELTIVVDTGAEDVPELAVRRGWDR